MVQFSCSVVSHSVTSWTAARQATLSITNSWNLLKLKSIELVMPSNHLILCRPLLLLSSICPSIRVFSNESVLPIRWPKYWSLSFSINPSNEYSGLISFRMDWLDLDGTRCHDLSLEGHKVVSLILGGEWDMKCSHICCPRYYEITWRQCQRKFKRGTSFWLVYGKNYYTPSFLTGTELICWLLS